MSKPLAIAVVGCGHICHQYAAHIKQYPELLRIAGATDLDHSRAVAFCEANGGTPYADFDAALADDEVDVILNLTVHHAHFDLNARALRAGKHVFSEKPMALSYEKALELIQIARENNRRLAAAPITFMGEGVQTAARFLREGNPLGTLRLVYAEVNWGQIERWISAPAPYFTVGPLLDVGVYAITALTFLLGPVRSVWGYSAILKNPRTGKNGDPFPVTAPDFTTGIMEFQNGVVARITTNYYVPMPPLLRHLRGFEFHGDEGSFIVNDYHNFDAICHYIPYNGATHRVPLLREPKGTMDRALGLAELALAIRENRPHKGSAEHAAHVIEIMEGLQRSADTKQPVEIRSQLDRPDLLSWASQAPLCVEELPPA